MMLILWALLSVKFAYGDGQVMASLTIPDLKREKSFDGISLPVYADFWKKWQLVTVRYRKDDGEQRFVYANPIAYKALVNHIRPFPDGAVFGKVAFLTGDDPAFPNSEEPKSFSRLQLMKKDSRAHKDTGGWGYAIYMFGAGGVPYNDERNTVVACQACHNLVPDRDFVFSTPAFAGDSPHGVGFMEERMKKLFSERDVSALSQVGQRTISLLSPQAPPAKVQFLSMELFNGSVDESVGVLVRYSRMSGKSFLLSDPKSKYLLASMPLPPTPTCKAPVRLATLQTFSTKPSEAPNQPMTKLGTACEGKITWESPVPSS